MRCNDKKSKEARMNCPAMDQYGAVLELYIMSKNIDLSSATLKNAKNHFLSYSLHKFC